MPEKASAARRPLIVIPARFSPGATALRYEAEVTARALARGGIRRRRRAAWSCIRTRRTSRSTSMPSGADLVC